MPHRRHRRSRAAAAACSADAGRPSGPRGSLPETAPDPGQLPARRKEREISFSRSSRARRTASFALVLTRLPDERYSIDGAATTDRTRAAVSARYSPNPVGPPSKVTAAGPGTARTQSSIRSTPAGSFAWNSSPVTPSIAADATDRA
jgi:hypothetical protein